MATAISPSQQQTNEGLVDKAWDAQEKLESRFSNIGKGKYGRVLRMARKPTPEEFRRNSLVAGAGLLVLGTLGFIIFYLMSFIPQG